MHSDLGTSPVAGVTNLQIVNGNLTFTNFAFLAAGFTYAFSGQCQHYLDGTARSSFFPFTVSGLIMIILILHITW